MKELKFEELSVKQKLGMIYTPLLGDGTTEEKLSDIMEQIRNHALGSIWIQWNSPNTEKFMQAVQAAADYPILIFTDAENGISPYMIGRHNTISCTGNEEYAYAFGKAVAVTARKMGYSVVCNPILDVSTTGSARSFGSDKYQVAKFAAAEAQGMHDGGVLTVGKHYPSGLNSKDIDSHMAEAYSEQTESELVDYSLYAYFELIKKGLLDGIMTAHERFVNIDPARPASLSKKIIDIIRTNGFDGFAITDALVMMGIRAKYGDVESKGLAIAAGNDLALPFDSYNVKAHQEALYTCYEKGIITDEQLDIAVKRVLAAQHKAMLLPKDAELTEKEIDMVNRIIKDSVFAKTDAGLPVSISRDGKHLFALMVRNEVQINENGSPKVEVDTFSAYWMNPNAVIQKIKALFPNSLVELYYQFPTQNQNQRILRQAIECEDVIMITFTEFLAYVGREHLTNRVKILMEAMQYTNRISTVVHFGNPLVLEGLPHIPRYILGALSAESIEACLKVLAGEYPANGKLTYNVHLN